MKASPGKVYRGESKGGKADVTVTIEDTDFIDLASGKIQGPQVGRDREMKEYRLIWSTVRYVNLLVNISS